MRLLDALLVFEPASWDARPLVGARGPRRDDEVGEEGDLRPQPPTLAWREEAVLLRAGALQHSRLEQAFQGLVDRVLVKGLECRDQLGHSPLTID